MNIFNKQSSLVYPIKKLLHTQSSQKRSAKLMKNINQELLNHVILH
ncbi:RNA methyltransferase, partial [Bacillus thuringiensis]